MEPAALVERIENAAVLDTLVQPVKSLWDKVFADRQLADAFHGVWLGHPLHPLLTDVPIGCWTAAAILDVLPGTGHAAGTLIVTGAAASVPTVLAGWDDWRDLHEQQLRVGLVHATANVVGLVLYTRSLWHRVRGRKLRGKAYAYAGLVTVGVGGYLGGHLAYRQAAGTNHAEYVPHTVPQGWQRVCDLDELTDGEPVRRMLGEVPLFVLRSGDRVEALADSCSHLSGPLSEGSVTLEGGERCVVCPWHGSVFRVRDGGVVHGPATASAPAFESRVSAGAVEVMLPGAG